MATSVPPTRTTSNAGVAPAPTNGRRWGGNGHRSPVAELVAPRLGMRAVAVEKLIYGTTNVFDRCAKIIEGYIEADDLVGLTRRMASIDAARARIAPCALTVDVARTESETDQAEQVAQDILAVAPSREHALAFIRRSQAARAAALEYELAVAKHWQLWL